MSRHIVIPGPLMAQSSRGGTAGERIAMRPVFAGAVSPLVPCRAVGHSDVSGATRGQLAQSSGASIVDAGTTSTVSTKQDDEFKVRIRVVYWPLTGATTRSFVPWDDRNERDLGCPVPGKGVQP